MPNRFPEEKYTVITDWPGTENHNEGECRCFHYTLTRDQVAQCRDAALAASNGSNPSQIAVSTGFGLGLLRGTIGINTIYSVVNLFNAHSDLSNKAFQTKLFGIWKSIHRHMVDFHYQRVTISQELELQRVRSDTPWSHPLPVKKWVPINVPRVPLEKYYLKN